MAGRYSSSGATNITIVDGTTRTGLIAADGSINVVQSTTNTLKGIYHPSGAFNATVIEGNQGVYAPDGSLYISEIDNNRTPFFVNVVSGSLSGLNNELREDGELELREDGTLELREAVASSYTAKAVHFNGNTNLFRSALTAANGNDFSCAFWFKYTPTATVPVIFAVDVEDNYTQQVYLASSPVGAACAFFPLWNVTAESVIQIQSNESLNYNIWHSFIASGNSNSGIGKIYIDDVDLTVIGTNNAPFSMVFNDKSMIIGQDTYGDDFTGDMADLWIAPNVSLLVAGDIPEATRRLFISATGKPVNPSGFPSSAILFSGDSSTFPINQGTGGVFTLTGSLTNASTSPSD